MSECGDSVSNCSSLLSVLMRVRGVLLSLSRVFVSSQVILLVLLLGDTMGVRRVVM